MSHSTNKNHHLLFISSALAFFLLSLLIAVGPAFVMDRSAKRFAEDRKMTPEEARGFKIYVRENCAVCHTQQVRPLEMDSEFGRPSLPSDYAGIRPLSTWVMTPNVLGTARIGPDLSNVGEHRQNEMWNYIHLYQPRAVVKESVMPAFTWLFSAVDKIDSADIVITIPEEFKPAGKAIVPTQEARDLIAYLGYLKQKSAESHKEKPMKMGTDKPGGKLISRIYNTKQIEAQHHNHESFTTHDFSNFEFVIISISILIVVLAFVFLIKTLFWVNEHHREHIKHKILDHK